MFVVRKTSILSVWKITFTVHAIFLIIIVYSSIRVQSQQDPSTLNGGSLLAMTGENCVAIAVDKRFGSGPQMVNVSPRIILTPHTHLVVGFTGFEGDVQSLAQELSVHISTKIGRHLGFGFDDIDRDDLSISVQSRSISPTSMTTLVSHVLYGKRKSPYYVEPIVAGLETVSADGDNESEGNDENGRREKYVPYLCALDMIGAKSLSQSFVCSGAASKSLYGTAEAMWTPGLKPHELVNVCGRAFLSALERDCLSGYGAIVYLMIGGEGIVEYELSCRND